MPSPEPEPWKFEVWCQGHIDYCMRRNEKPHPLADGLTWNQAQARKAQAQRECADEAVHFIRRVPAPDAQEGDRP